MKKRILPLALGLVMVLSITAGAIIPRLIATGNVTSDFYISGSTAHCELYVKAKTTDAKISGTVILYRVNGDEYTKLTSWPISATGTLDLVKTYSSITSGSYEMYYSVTVSNANGTDKITDAVSATKR